MIRTSYPYRQVRLISLVYSRKHSILRDLDRNDRNMLVPANRLPAGAERGTRTNAARARRKFPSEGHGAAWSLDGGVASVADDHPWPEPRPLRRLTTRPPLCSHTPRLPGIGFRVRTISFFSGIPHSTLPTADKTASVRRPRTRLRMWPQFFSATSSAAQRKSSRM